MPGFMLNVVVQDHNRTPLSLATRIGWRALPGIGEQIATEDSVYRVDMVTHDIGTGRIYITVSPL